MFHIVSNWRLFWTNERKRYKRNDLQCAAWDCVGAGRPPKLASTHRRPGLDVRAIRLVNCTAALEAGRAPSPLGMPKGCPDRYRWMTDECALLSTSLPSSRLLPRAISQNTRLHQHPLQNQPMLKSYFLRCYAGPPCRQRNRSNRLKSIRSKRYVPTACARCHNGRGSSRARVRHE